MYVCLRSALNKIGIPYVAPAWFVVTLPCAAGAAGAGALSSVPGEAVEGVFTPSAGVLPGVAFSHAPVQMHLQLLATKVPVPGLTLVQLHEQLVAEKVPVPTGAPVAEGARISAACRCVYLVSPRR